MPKHKLGKLETGGSATQQSSGIKVMAYLIFQGFSNMKKKKKEMLMKNMELKIWV